MQYFSQPCITVSHNSCTVPIRVAAPLKMPVLTASGDLNRNSPWIGAASWIGRRSRAPRSERADEPDQHPISRTNAPRSSRPTSPTKLSRPSAGIRISGRARVAPHQRQARSLCVRNDSASAVDLARPFDSSGDERSPNYAINVSLCCSGCNSQWSLR